MRVGVMVTNGGSHPPEKWAEESAKQIVDVIQIEPTYPNAEAALQAKNVLRDKIAAALVKHHTAVQDHTKDHLQKHGHDLAAPLNEIDLTPHVEFALDDAIKTVLETSKGTMFEQHFAQPHVVKFVQNTIGSHFATVAQIEHSWHRDRQGA